jgi:hypothetical protein
MSTKLFLNNVVNCMEFEVITAMTTRNAVFWNVVLYVFIKNRHFGKTRRLHLQPVTYRLTLFLARVVSFTLKMKATCSSETSI